MDTRKTPSMGDKCLLNIFEPANQAQSFPILAKTIRASYRHCHVTGVVFA